MRDTGGERFYFKRKPRTKTRGPWFVNRGPSNDGACSPIRAPGAVVRVSLLTGQGLRNRG
jgi:hypothetical protein